jgi:peroxiredoxin Q/BCP
MGTARLEAGQVAPDFTLNDHDGNAVSLSQLRGQNVVVYFYPAAGTPACTSQACDFRDNVNSLASAGYHVLGISKDSVDDLAGFKREQGINFPLLSDIDLDVHKMYGAYGEKSLYGKTVTGVLRSTFVIDEAGTIRLALYNVKAKGHVAMLRKRLAIDA